MSVGAGQEQHVTCKEAAPCPCIFPSRLMKLVEVALISLLARECPEFVYYLDVQMAMSTL